MKIKYSIKQSGLDVNKKIYECSVCENLFNWDGKSSWFGSDLESEEHPERIKYFCSPECFKKWAHSHLVT